MHALRRYFPDNTERDYDAIMIITAFGILAYSTFAIIAGILNDNSFEPGELVVANGLAEVLEVAIQLLFVADLKHKRVDSETNQKHGRQIVTFLLITNLGLWITYNFEIQKVILGSSMKFTVGKLNILLCRSTLLPTKVSSMGFFRGLSSKESRFLSAYFFAFTRPSF